MAIPSTKKRVLSGMRSTGKLHLGNYVGALENWVRMQEQYDCFFFIADWHALTTDYADTSRLKENSVEVLLDWLAAGLDPAKCVMFIQSHVPAHAELHLLLSMITPLGWLERVPTYKEQRENIKEKDLGTYGFLGYPVLQSADILIYKADVVPVGEDQVAHVELTREIARRFNGFYAGKREYVFPEPQSLLTPAPKLPGTDGRKMSKSYGNTIMLTFGDKNRATKTRQAGNYMSFRGNRLRFGKLTMTDVDMILIDMDPTDPFDFFVDRYKEQIAAGYSKISSNSALRIFVRDFNKLKKPGAAAKGAN